MKKVSFPSWLKRKIKFEHSSEGNESSGRKKTDHMGKSSCDGRKDKPHGWPYSLFYLSSWSVNKNKIPFRPVGHATGGCSHFVSNFSIVRLFYSQSSFCFCYSTSLVWPFPSNKKEENNFFHNRQPSNLVSPDAYSTNNTNTDRQTTKTNMEQCLHATIFPFIASTGSLANWDMVCMSARLVGIAFHPLSRGKTVTCAHLTSLSMAAVMQLTRLNTTSNTHLYVCRYTYK